MRDIVLLARKNGCRVVPVGRASAYWNPLQLAGAYAVDVSGLQAAASAPTDDSFLSFGAGETVRDVHDALVAVGSYLPLYPDAFGTTSIGAAVAVGCAAGLGMGLCDIDQLVTGLTVVLGSGEVVKTGAANVIGSPAFIRTGMADPTGLFLGSQGSFGIITEVHIRRWPRPRVAHISCELVSGDSIKAGDSKRLRQAARVATDLKSRNLFDTFRITGVYAGPEAGARIDLWVVSDGDRAELDVRVAQATRHLSARLPDVELDVSIDDSATGVDRFRHPANGLDHLMANERLSAVDVLVPHAALDAALDVADEVMKEAHVLGTHPRIALYAAPSYLNLGLHVPAPQGDEKRFHSAIRRWAAALTRLPASPYRWGGVWRPLFQEYVDPGYTSLMSGVRQVCDPDGVLSTKPAVSSPNPDPVPPTALSESESAPLLRALAVEDTCPRDLTTFDSIVGRGPFGPDTFEYSVSVGRDPARWRLSHYFDVTDRRYAVVEAHTRFVEAAGALGIPLSPAIRAYLAEASATDAIQVAVGIDARPDPTQTRLKYYLICDQKGVAPCESLRAAAGIEIPSRLTAARTHILGLDFRREGLHDMKVYHSLDVGQLPRIFRKPDLHRVTIDGAKHAVLHECVGQTRERKLHVSFSDTPTLERLMVSELGTVPGTRAMLTHVAELNEHEGVDIFPWILARTYADGTLEKAPYTVYFHPRSS